MSFHVNAAGNAGECRAQKGGCPFGSAEEHFSSANEARENFERNMSAETVTSVKLAPTRFAVSGSFEPGQIIVAKLPSEMIHSDGSIVLPAGRYFVGDPCYTAGKDDKAWQETCNLKGNDGEVFAATFNGLPVIGLHTAHGDGSYYDDDGREYGVDAGLIGAVPEELVRKMELSDDDLEGSGHWIETKTPFILEHGNDGALFIGGIVIETDPQEEEEDDPWDRYEDEELDDDEAQRIMEAG